MPGVLELLPREQVAFQRMIDTIRRVYETYGFTPLETPAIELTEVLLTKTGGETERQVYLVQSTGAAAQGAEPDLALRFDLTVPLARYVAEHRHRLVFPFRRYQIQPVWRGESPQRGRFREFYQCDIDVVGRDHLPVAYDAEMPAVIAAVFRELGVGPFLIRINNRKLMRGWLETLGVEGSRQVEVLRIVDKLERDGPEAVARRLTEFGMERVDDLVAVLADQDHTDPLELLPSGSPSLEQGIEELREVLSGLALLGVPTDVYRVDLAVARGLDYYTGTVYETTLVGHPEVGSICSGGRYDDLAAHFTDDRLPGVGISIGLTRLFWQLRELGMVGEGLSNVVAYVTLMDSEGRGYAFEAGNRLRRAGIPTQVALEPDRLGRQLKYADRAGIRFALIAGTEERERGTVTVRDLASQTQTEVPLDDLVTHLERGTK
jgi:histidyl-tRNA synthetase